MRKRLGVFIAFFFIAAVFIGYGAYVYNHLISKEEGVRASWSQVLNQYERRSELIPNLVSTVKGYAAHEQETLTKVVEARSKAMQFQMSSEDLDGESLQSFFSAQDDLTQALSKLMVSVEAYPELKASDAFVMLQSQLEGTENRITVERRRFIEQTRLYNSYLRRFPNNFVAKIMGFNAKDYFDAIEGADKSVKVEF